MVQLTSQQFSYSANWGKRSQSKGEKVSEALKKSESIEEDRLSEANLMDIILSREDV